MKISYNINIPTSIKAAEVRARESPYEIGGTLELSPFLEVKHVIDYLKYEISCYYKNVDTSMLDIDVYYKNYRLHHEDNNVKKVIQQIDAYP